MCGVELDFVEFKAPHKGEEISNVLSKIIQTYHLKGKVVGIVVDNASANNVAMQNIATTLNLNESTYPTPKEVHFRCFAHILNLACKGQCLNAIF